MVQALLDAGDPNGLPRRSLGIHLLDQRYYYFTAIPVPLDERVVGVVIVGTSLDTLLPHFKLTSLADVTIYHDEGKAIGSTFTLADPPESKANTLTELSITPESYQSILSSVNVTTGENVEIRDRSYRLARGPLRVGNDSLGVFSVALPTNFIVEQRATNRNIYIAVFVTTMLGVVVVGYAIAQLIIRPLSSLVRTSQAVADGDLEQRTGIVRGDEIGFLAETFDEMTGRLADRTRALEETLGRMKAMLEDLEQNLIPLNAAAEFMLQEMAENFLLGPLRELTSGNPGGALDQPTWPADQRRFEVGKKVLSAQSAAVRTEDGEHLGTVIVLRDVTAEAEADRVKNAFVAHVSHELRTPLTAIKGYSELMLIGAAGPTSSEQQGFLKTIHNHTESLVNMINTLLDFSEIEAWDRLKLNRYPVQLSTLLEETIEPWYPEMEEKGLDFKVDISENLPVVNADNKRLTWVIVNLIRNAWQYTPSGGCVTVRLYEQNGNVVLDVQDTGVGISKEDQQKLFSRFYRVADTTQVRGIGLGLYVAKAIIDGHEGKIQVRSEEGAGSTFSVIMPVLKE
jgi:signal transduction histidine kinase/HAMP domain-containing protein